jgi:hypothetical protein
MRRRAPVVEPLARRLSLTLRDILRMMGKPVVRYADRNFVMTQWHNVMISDQDERLQLSHLRMLRETTALAAAEHPSGIVSIALVREGMQPSDRATTRELIRYHREEMARSPMISIIVVIEAGGVLGAAIRTMVRTMITLSGFHRMTIRATASEAIAAILPHVRPSDGSSVARAELEDAVSFVRAQLDAQRIAASPHAAR